MRSSVYKGKKSLFISQITIGAKDIIFYIFDGVSLADYTCKPHLEIRNINVFLLTQFFLNCFEFAQFKIHPLKVKGANIH